MRKLVSIKIIDDILPIDGAEMIECAIIGGWKVVVKKGEFKIGDFAVYHEIDSWLPLPNDNYSFLMKESGSNKVFEEIEGYRLRTIKLKGQISQGLLLPISSLMNFDLSESIGVKKWGKYLNQSGSCKPKGNFPFFIRKTDQERIQNLKKELSQWSLSEDEWEVTEKLDGSSMTCFVKDGVFGVCSRNLELLCDEDNIFWKAALKDGIESKLLSVGKDIAIQGELISFNIQGNPYKLSQGEFKFLAFDVFDISEQKYLSSYERREFCRDLNISHVPYLGTTNLIGDSVDSILIKAEGLSYHSEVQREGIVYKNIKYPSISFKAISNKWLLKQGE